MGNSFFPEESRSRKIWRRTAEYGNAAVGFAVAKRGSARELNAETLAGKENA
jgi:hypothetical protein